MTDAGNWCLIESDPGVFTELIHKFGVTGLQVEELWSLDKEQFADLKPVFGWVSVSDYSKLRLSLAKHKTLKNEKYCEDQMSGWKIKPNSNKFGGK